MDAGEAMNAQPTDARAAVLARVSEKAFQQQVMDLLLLCGWRAVHVYDMRRSAPGLPDILALRGHRLVVAELKSERGVVRPEQWEWLDAFAQAGAETFLWRPSDFEELTEVLR
jgi:hypothetical protein